MDFSLERLHCVCCHIEGRVRSGRAEGVVQEVLGWKCWKPFKDLVLQGLPYATSDNRCVTWLFYKAGWQVCSYLLGHILTLATFFLLGHILSQNKNNSAS